MKRETPSREELQKALLSRCSQEDAAKLAKAKWRWLVLGDWALMWPYSLPEREWDIFNL